MEEILRRFCAYGMEYKDHEGYTHDWVPLNWLIPQGKIKWKSNSHPVSLVKPYFQTEEDTFPSRKKNPTPPKIVEVEDSPGPVMKIMKARKISINGKDQRKYLVKYKNQKADKYKWLEEDAIPDGNLHLRYLRASRRTEKYHK
ncbi:hypothetical protein O181_109358 [Austropuccinia psidii MF-1]|uniref:Chromo domain-containing protein n=1 Tax=Austropuccinia psidii MF-1 TaxID=1389203 RepID=A0A9Q3PPR9_9BASI|nr:hypothetical protein [Austropuccinia psidii MF-1]